MKKTLKLLMLVAVMFAAVTSVAKAQDAGAAPARRGGGRGNQKAALLKDIAVDSVTDAKIDAIMQTYGAEQRTIMQAARDAGGQPDMAKVESLMNKRNAEIKALLKEEHKKLFDANAEAVAAARRAPRPPAGA